jgi:hypothetical protein
VCGGAWDQLEPDPNGMINFNEYVEMMMMD